MIILNEGNVTPKLNTAAEGTNEDSNMWYLDNGASNHMTGQRSKFTELDKNVTGRVKFGDDSTVSIQEKGTVHFITNNGEVHALKEVYFIPNLCNNIISLVS